METLLTLVPIFFVISVIYSAAGLGGGSSYLAILDPLRSLIGVGRMGSFRGGEIRRPAPWPRPCAQPDPPASRTEKRSCPWARAAPPWSPAKTAPSRRPAPGLWARHLPRRSIPARARSAAG